MEKAFDTLLEERVLASKQDEDLGPLLVEFWNNRKQYRIDYVVEGCVKEPSSISGIPIYANKYFRVIAEDRSTGHIKYHFMRDGGNLVSTILVIPNPQEPKPTPDQVPEAPRKTIKIKRLIE